MKKLILLSLMMLLCGKSFSQKDTQSKVTIDTIIAKKIAIDLVRGDECKVELEITKKNVLLLKEKHIIKDSIIGNYKKQLDNLNKIVFNKDNLLKISEENLLATKNQLSKSKKNTLIFQGTTLITIGISVLLILK
jgi:hypothetical protein